MGGSLWPMSEVARLEKLAGEGRKEFTPSRAYFMAFIPCSYSLKWGPFLCACTLGTRRIQTLVQEDKEKDRNWQLWLFWLSHPDQNGKISSSLISCFSPCLTFLDFIIWDTWSLLFKEGAVFKNEIFSQGWDLSGFICTKLYWHISH